MNLAAMMKRTSSCAAVFVATAIFFNATSAQAGPLNTPANLALSYNGSWAGTSAFQSILPDNITPGDLSGYVDWAVFEAANFPYGGFGYVPTPGELVYVYQVYVTGIAPVSHFTVDTPNFGNNIGSFTSFGTVTPSASSIGLEAAIDFHAPAIPMGSNSIGLAFSSNKVPQNWFGSLVDHGEDAQVVPLPSPSNINVPEPATVALLCLGGALLAPTAVRRLRKR